MMASTSCPEIADADVVVLPVAECTLVTYVTLADAASVKMARLLCTQLQY